MAFGSIKKLHGGKLFVGDGENPYFSVRGQQVFHTAHVYFGIFAAGTVAHVDGELEHGETVAQEVLAEVGCRFPFALGFGGKVEKYKYPHNSVFAEAVHGGREGLAFRKHQQSAFAAETAYERGGCGGCGHHERTAAAVDADFRGGE